MYDFKLQRTDGDLSTRRRTGYAVSKLPANSVGVPAWPSKRVVMSFHERTRNRMNSTLQMTRAVGEVSATQSPYKGAT